MFINVTHPSQLRQRDTQQAIRRRVMRDIGRSRRKRPRPITVTIDVPTPESSDGTNTSGDHHDEETRRVSSHQSNTEISKTLQPYGYFAVQPTTRARELFHFMHGTAGKAYRPFRMEWFAMAIADRCAFYLCLANAALFSHQLTKGRGSYEYTDCEESAGYFAKCTGMMARRLGEGGDGVCEGVVTTVLGFLCHDAAVAKWDRWAIHMDGLQRILYLRHGFSGLSELTCLMAFWFDVTGSAMHDTAPRFDIPSGLAQQSVAGCELSPALATVLSSLTTTGNYQLIHLSQALGQTALVADLINKNAHDPSFWDGGMGTTRFLGPAAHYALSIPRISSAKTLPAYGCAGARAQALLCEMVRLALLIFISGLKSAFCLSAGEMSAFQERFVGLLPLLLPEVAIEFCPELAVWCLVIIACSYDRRCRPPVLVTAIREFMERTAITTPRDAIELARSVIWADSIMALEAEGLAMDVAAEVHADPHD